MNVTVDQYTYPNGESFWCVFIGGKPIMTFNTLADACEFAQ